jgi:hypothetical protein
MSTPNTYFPPPVQVNVSMAHVPKSELPYHAVLTIMPEGLDLSGSNPQDRTTEPDGLPRNNQTKKALHKAVHAPDPKRLLDLIVYQLRDIVTPPPAKPRYDRVDMPDGRVKLTIAKDYPPGRPGGPLSVQDGEVSVKNYGPPNYFSVFLQPVPEREFVDDFSELAVTIREQLKQWPVFGETAWGDLNDESPFLTIHAPE